ncbi:response regulator [Oceanospirillum sediminis]|uniref:Response regulator n=1 Tax=Oceanospirillum sediminis TaxID=2760088 RepID=A0A839IL01_9GAMM|nr:response regulator [Oceanospirillum sediminis]MBB1485222.1 response regulator [Oceanospirillum sediminis]
MAKVNKVVAVVDDDPDTLDFLEEVLCSYVTVCFACSEDLLTWLAGGHLPELILSDVMMEDIDGYELCRQLKSSEKYAAIPVVLMSGMTADIDFRLAIESGADEYIEKPVRRKRLLEVLQNKLCEHCLLDDCPAPMNQESDSLKPCTGSD